MDETDLDSTSESPVTPTTIRSPSSQSSCPAKVPRLGDFSRIALSSISTPATQPSRPRDDYCSPISSPTPQRSSPFLSRLERPSSSSSDKSASLGDFSKLLGLLRSSLPSPTLTRETPDPFQDPQPSLVAKPTISILKRGDASRSVEASTHPFSVSQLVPLILNTDEIGTSVSSQSEREVISETENSDSDGTAATSLGSSVEQGENQLKKKSSLIVSSRPPVTTRQRGDSLKRRKAFPNSSTHGATNTSTILLTDVRSKAKRHESLSMSLSRHYTNDNHTFFQHPTCDPHGIHVFLDLSNIHISFRRALQTKFGADNNARFAPNPDFNFEFFTEILVRGRPTRVLNAGCSVRPDRSQPAFIDILHKLGYHVDVRERKLVSESKSTTGKSVAAATMPKGGRSRTQQQQFQQEDIHYVEDLVDETLQIRIGESVMEYFDHQGTLVLATGDGQPAKFSDGFFTYADRALRMGWNVELVSWNRGLSSTWRNPEWTSRWGSRFRIIELDEFLDDLWLPST